MNKKHVVFLLILLIPGAFHAFIPKVVSFGIFTISYIVLFITVGLKSYLQPVRNEIFLYILFFLVIYLAFHFLYVVATGVEVLEYARYLFVFLIPILVLPITNGLKTSEDALYIIKCVVLISSIICVVILATNMLHGSFGRVEAGIYFSTMYIFVTILLLGLWLSKIKILTNFEFILALSLHLLRAFIDFRRSPIAIIILGFVLISLYLLCIRGRKNLNSDVYLMFLLIMISVFIFDIVDLFVSLSFYDKYVSRLSFDVLKIAFEIRFSDYFQVLQNGEWSRLIGAGLGYSFLTDNNSDIHSLYMFIFSNLGAVGLCLILALIFYPIVVGLKSSSKGADKKLKALLSISLFCYFLFFTFSARGSEYESFMILAIVIAIQYKFKYFELKS